MIDPYKVTGLQKQSIEAVQHQGAQCQADKHGSQYVVDGFAGHGSTLHCWQVADQAIRPMELHFVLAGEAAAPHGALQVFGKVEHHTFGSVTTGEHSLVCAVDIVVVPYDDGELFSLHFDLRLQVTDVGLAPHWVD